LSARQLAGGLVAVVAVGALVAALVVRDGSGSAASGDPPAFATASATVGALRVTGGYLPQPASPSVAAAYFTVTNGGSVPDALVSASSDVSSEVGLHDTVSHGSTASMVAISALTVPAHGDAVLTPGGRHLMLMNPTRTLVVGDHVTLHLRFRNAGTVDLRVPVVSLTAAAAHEHS